MKTMEANTGKFSKKPVGVFVAIFALLVSASAVYLDCDHDKKAVDDIKAQMNINEEQNRQLDELVETQKQQIEELKELRKTHEQHYDELEKEFEAVIAPHIRHIETFNYLTLLYDRLMRYRDWLTYLSGDTRAWAEHYYNEASDKFQRAEKELRAGNFTEAEKLIEAAYDDLVEGASIASG